MRSGFKLWHGVLLIVAVGAVIAIIALAIRSIGGRVEAPIRLSPAFTGADGAMPAFDLDPVKLGMAEIRRSIEEALIERLTVEFPVSRDVPNRAGLVGAVGETLELYLAGRFEDYMKILEAEKGGAVSEQDAALFRSQWEYGSAIISMAPLSREGIRMSLGRERIALSEVMERSDITRRGAGGFDDISDVGDRLIEVEIPAIIRPQGGPRSAGYIGFSYGFDARTGAWRLVRTTLVKEAGPGIILPIPP